MLIITISYLTPEDSHVNLTIQHRITDVAHYNDKDTTISTTTSQNIGYNDPLTFVIETFSLSVISRLYAKFTF